MKGNPRGLRQFNELIQHMSRGQVPPRTPIGVGYELDLRINVNETSRLFTIVDIAGETSSLLTAAHAEVSPSDLGNLTQVDTEVSDVLAKYLSARSSQVLVICFIDIFSTDFHPSDQELGAENLLMHIKQKFPHISNILIVFTKIDKFDQGSTEPAMSYEAMREKANLHARRHSLFYKMYKNPTNVFGDRISIMPFAIGRVDEHTGAIQEHFDGGFDRLATFLRLGDVSKSRQGRATSLIIGLLAFALVIVSMRVRDSVSLPDLIIAFVISILASIVATKLAPLLKSEDE